jgi:hypothetical protein
MCPCPWVSVFLALLHHPPCLYPFSFLYSSDFSQFHCFPVQNRGLVSVYGKTKGSLHDGLLEAPQPPFTKVKLLFLSFLSQASFSCQASGAYVLWAQSLCSGHGSEWCCAFLHRAKCSISFHSTGMTVLKQSWPKNNSFPSIPHLSVCSIFSCLQFRSAVLVFQTKNEYVVYHSVKIWPGKWLTAIILATWEVEIERMMAQGQPGQKDLETPLLNQKARFGDTGLSLRIKHK